MSDEDDKDQYDTTPSDQLSRVIPTASHPDLYLPIYVVTGIYGAIFIILPLLIRKGPNQGLIRCCIWVATFSMWILWFTIYVSQMNPLVGPRMKNTTLAWIAHTWGREAEPPAPTPPPDQDSEYDN